MLTLCIISDEWGMLLIKFLGTFLVSGLENFTLRSGQ